jgi:hypothetical protein
MMPRRAENDTDMALAEGFYRMDLEDLPVEELIKAFGDWRSGRHKRSDNSPFAPSIGEVRALVEKRISDRLMNAKRYRELQAEAEETRAYRARMATQTPKDRYNVEIVQKIIHDLATRDIRPNGRCFPFGKPSQNEFTLEQLADWECIVNRPGQLPYTFRVDEKGVPLRIPFGYNGAGQLVEYGYLTSKEARIGREKEINDFARETIR